MISCYFFFADLLHQFPAEHLQVLSTQKICHGWQYIRNSYTIVFRISINVSLLMVIHVLRASVAFIWPPWPFPLFAVLP